MLATTVAAVAALSASDCAEPPPQGALKAFTWIAKPRSLGWRSIAICTASLTLGPKDAPNPGDALTFVNYLLEPRVIAKSTNFVTYANPNPASKPFVEKSILDDPTIYPPPEVMSKLFLVTPYDQKVQRVVTRLWQKVKTGQ